MHEKNKEGTHPLVCLIDFIINYPALKKEEEH